MLKRHAQFLQSLLFLFDLALISACWMAAYYIRVVAGWGPVDKGVPPLEIYTLFALCLFCSCGEYLFGHLTCIGLDGWAPIWPRFSTLL